ncbi:MAG: hypothetical protein IJV39_01090 [Ruminococcus sp.]|nr:hypothetical protein [Ruminococcus sp.]
MANIVFGFGCGIAYMYLLKRLKDSKNKKFKCGENDVCKDCKFYKIIMDSIDEVEDNADCKS